MDEKDINKIILDEVSSGSDDSAVNIPAPAEDLALDIDVTAEPEPEVGPYLDIEPETAYVNAASEVEAAADEFGSSYSDPVYEQPSPSNDESSDEAPAFETPVNEEPAYEAPAYTRPAPARRTREPRYVTTGALVVCMVLTMLVSAILGAMMGAMFAGKGGDTVSVTPDTGSSSQSISQSTGSELTVAQIVDKNENAVVEIMVSGTTQNFFGQMQLTEGAGSGVIINKDGYIVTNYHVIQGANKITVKLHNGESYSASLVGGDNDNDIAVIKINASNLTPAVIGDSSTVDVGDLAVAIGNPLGQLGGTATTGIISALDRVLTIEGRTMSLMQTDAAINPGNSGGGLFNSQGDLIGIVDAKSGGNNIEGLAFAIPINNVIGIINDLVENGRVSGKPSIGIVIQDVSEDNASYYGLESAGVYIARVTGQNAETAGFEQGDRIVSFNGEAIENSSDLISKVRACKVGDTVSVVVSRSGQEIEIKTVLEETIVTQ